MVLERLWLWGTGVIFGVQILRGVAAMMVVFAHIQSHLYRFQGGDLGWLSAGVGGVDLFFVISGFIIWSTSQSDRMTPGTFMFRRAVRIVPLYWLTTTFVVLVVLVAPSLTNSAAFQLSHVIASYVFVPMQHPVLKDLYPILVPGWSLNFEAFFYALFGIGLLLPNRLMTFYACLATLTGLVLAGFVLRPANHLLYFYTDPIILEFAFGLCIGLFYTHGPKIPLGLALSAVPIGALGIAWAAFADMTNDHHVRFFAVGLPAALIVFGITAAKRNEFDPSNAFLVALGDASYSIYLTHVIVVPAGVRLWQALGLGYGAPQMFLFMAAEIALVIAVGLLVHRLVERPLIDVFRKRSAPNDLQIARSYNTASNQSAT